MAHSGIPPGQFSGLRIFVALMLETFGYAAAALIGLSLGLIGGGGSILTVPVLVYLFRIDIVVATSYSLFIVGVTSLAGVIPKFRSNQVNFRLALLFGLPSIAAVHFARAVLVPDIPAVVGHIGNVTITRGEFLLLLFAVLMLAASYSMIKGGIQMPVTKERTENKKVFLIMLDGIVIGTLTGLVGAGGGFIIIPALIFMGGLAMKEAVGTSLLIIASNSLFGFAGDAGLYPIRWKLLFILTAISVAGIFAGHRLTHSIESHRLKKYFGWFVLTTGVYILIHELLLS